MESTYSRWRLGADIVVMSAATIAFIWRWRHKAACLA